MLVVEFDICPRWAAAVGERDAVYMQSD